MEHPTWWIYGANGFTGSRIAEEAARRGLRPVLAGRSAENLRPLADRLGLSFQVVDLRDAPSLRQALSGAHLVLNAAGPFLHTGEPLMHACLAAGSHYLDVSNEVPVFLAARALDRSAREKGVVLLPGVGFGVVATNCLARFVKEQLPDATELLCAVAPYTAYRSTGVTKTVLEVLPHGGLIRRDGRQVPRALGSPRAKVPFPDRERTVVAVPTGDLEAAYAATGIPNIVIYSSEFPTGPLFRALLPLFQRALKSRRLRQQLQNWVGRNPGPPSPSSGPHRPSFAWAKAVGPQGQTVEAWLEMAEGYHFTALSSVRAVQELLRNPRKGFLTPAEAFGADFVLGIEGTRRFTALPQGNRS